MIIMLRTYLHVHASFMTYIRNVIRKKCLGRNPTIIGAWASQNDGIMVFNTERALWAYIMSSRLLRFSARRCSHKWFSMFWNVDNHIYCTDARTQTVGGVTESASFSTIDSQRDSCSTCAVVFIRDPKFNRLGKYPARTSLKWSLNLPLLMFPERSPNDPWTLSKYSLDVPWIFPQRSRKVPPECSPNVPRAASRERRAQREEERLRAVERKVRLLEKGSRSTRRGTWLFLLFFIGLYLCICLLVYLFVLTSSAALDGAQDVIHNDCYLF
jgi:hypothetical protein